MNRLLVVLALALVALSPTTACEPEGPNCCALKKFCSTCTTCSSDFNAMAAMGDEAKCKVIVDRFRSEAMFCNPENADPKHTIDEFLLQCGGQ
ncbi:MAG TPA: hypothetical protein VN914_12430 [Polyangia bacterium]|nr:hypothetical protein [Polyangia bacterium]